MPFHVRISNSPSLAVDTLARSRGAFASEVWFASSPSRAWGLPHSRYAQSRGRAERRTRSLYNCAWPRRRTAHTSAGHALCAHSPVCKIRKHTSVVATVTPDFVRRSARDGSDGVVRGAHRSRVYLRSAFFNAQVRNSGLAVNAPGFHRLPGLRLPPPRPFSLAGRERSQRPARPHLAQGNRAGTIHAFRRPWVALSSSGALFTPGPSNAASRPPHPVPRT